MSDQSQARRRAVEALLQRDVGAQSARPVAPPEMFAVPEPSDLFSRLQAFLPQIRDANAQLEQGEGRVVMDVDDSLGAESAEGAQRPYVELDLGLGVFEERPNRATRRRKRKQKVESKGKERETQPILDGENQERGACKEQERASMKATMTDNLSTAKPSSASDDDDDDDDDDMSADSNSTSSPLSSTTSNSDADEDSTTEDEGSHVDDDGEKANEGWRQILTGTDSSAAGAHANALSGAEAFLLEMMAKREAAARSRSTLNDSGDGDDAVDEEDQSREEGRKAPLIEEMGGNVLDSDE